MSSLTSLSHFTSLFSEPSWPWSYCS